MSCQTNLIGREGSSTISRSTNIVRHVIERDGRKRRKKSLYAQNPYVYVRIKLLYAQKPYVYVRIKSLYAQKPYVYVRIELLYVQKSYIVRTSRFERISRLRAKAVLYVRIK